MRPRTDTDLDAPKPTSIDELRRKVNHYIANWPPGTERNPRALLSVFGEYLCEALDREGLSIEPNFDDAETLGSYLDEVALPSLIGDILPRPDSSSPNGLWEMTVASAGYSYDADHTSLNPPRTGRDRRVIEAALRHDARAVIDRFMYSKSSAQRCRSRRPQAA